MKIDTLHSSIGKIEADAVVVNLFHGVTSPGGATGAVDGALANRISRLVAAGDLKGRLGETVVLDTGDEIGAPRVIVVGLGESSDFGPEQVRVAAAAAAKVARKRGVGHLATISHGAGIGGLGATEAAQATVEGTVLGLYRFTNHKSAIDGDSDGGIERLSLVETDAAAIWAIESGASAGAAIASAACSARDMGNHPANTATPGYLVDRAREIAGKYDMRLTAWDRERIVEEGMGAFASVAAGTHEPPYFIDLEYAPSGTASRAPYVLAGKAITFDSGGISLKPGLRMGRMKYDMCGGAAVLGAMEAIGGLGLPVHVHGLVAATENLPGGRATKPGDVVRALNGTTIEILNTDAEGRMVLADALSYGQRLRPRAVVDLATLTGAVLVALGKHAGGLFSNDDQLSAALAAAGDRCGERVWRLPTWEVYDAMIKSDVADIKNTGDSRPAPAGAIFAAKFLERFVDYPWVHLDIAGVAWGMKDVPYIPAGASGFGVRLLVDWLRAEVDRA